MTAQRLAPGWSTQRRARATMPIKSRMDRLVSQSTAGSQRRGGETAQNAPASLAAGAPKSLEQTDMMIATVSTANNVCSPIITAPETKL